MSNDLKYLALTDNGRENKVFAVIIFDAQVEQRIIKALTDEFDAPIEGLTYIDLDDCAHGRTRTISFIIDGEAFDVQAEQTWLY